MVKKFLALVILVCMAAACAKSPPPPPKPTNVQVDIQASSNINPDAEGNPSPLALRIYELKSATDFAKTDFVSLYSNDKAVLGANLVQKNEFFLKSNEKKTMNFVAADDTREIAAFAVFREYEQAQWKGSVPIQPHQNNVVTINVGTNKVELKSAVQAGGTGK